MKICVKERPFTLKKNKYILRSRVPSETESWGWGEVVGIDRGNQMETHRLRVLTVDNNPTSSVEGSWEVEKRRGGDHAGVLGSSGPALSQKEEHEEGQRKSEVRSFT